MKYSSLVESVANDTEKQEFLVRGEITAITIRISKNLRGAGKEAAALRDSSFSASIRMCMLDGLGKQRQ